MNNWSPNEIKLFQSIESKLAGFRPSKLWQALSDRPIQYYDQLIQACFLFDVKGPDVEALRKAMVGFYYKRINRHTEEFEKLLEF